MYHFQLTKEEAFRVCRYDWMREALKKFVTALSESRENDTIKELEVPLRPISEVEHQMPSQVCFGSHPSIQQLAA